MKSFVISFKIAIVCFFFLSTLLVQGQNQSVRERIFPIQSGTAELINGTATIQLNRDLVGVLSDVERKDATYFVTFTPINDCGFLTLKEKGLDKFVVKETLLDNKATSNKHSFDYIIYLKELMIFEVSTDAVK